uniref:RNA-dependent RNA polymerase n=1 Tax=Haemonchus placei TaxID=6290 RepID=A0A0N4X604_HAEPC
LGYRPDLCGCKLSIRTYRGARAEVALRTSRPGPLFVMVGRYRHLSNRSQKWAFH